ncbi:hypothetical protein BDY24DRAFT_103210 [Mrakia frigida]|uniref:uncharacterized protein n=1 Tax=Mrakia frigida TaxID=29902 RepID=UPI003FCBF109
MLECSICLDSLQGDDAALSSLRCGHLLHADCLAQHLAVYPRCPICSASTYANDPSIRRIYLSAPEQGTPSPELESALELVQVKQTLARTAIQLENERIEKEAVEREVILLSRERQAAEEELQRAEQ